MLYGAVDCKIGSWSWYYVAEDKATTFRASIPYGHGQVLTASLLIQLPAHTVGKSVDDRSSVWVPEHSCVRHRKSSWDRTGQLQPLWPFGEEPVDGKFCFLLLCLSCEMMILL